MRHHRTEKMASTVRMIVADAIRNKLSDPRIQPLTSVTRVELSADLQIANIYVSVLGTEAEARCTMAGLQNATGHIQRIVARKLTTRFCPQIRFQLDESLKRAAETIRIIDESVAVDTPHSPAGDNDHAEPRTDGAPE